MFKNRFVLIVAVLSLLLATLTVSGTISAASKPARPVIGPAASDSEYADYSQRHPELRVSVVNAVDTTDYFLRHSELRSGLTASIHIASDQAPLDECFDVSLSEVAACREADQSPSP